MHNYFRRDIVGEKCVYQKRVYMYHGPVLNTLLEILHDGRILGCDADVFLNLDLDSPCLYIKAREMTP
jgi:hypothetical protein